jgi:hypothetical protein
MKYDVLYHSQDEWLLLHDGTITRKQPYPTLRKPTLVVTDFNQAASGMIALEGNPTHATPLIQKRLRGDGLIDQDAKIIIHQNKNAGRSYQALYTAVEMDEWQRMLSWTENQPDHCLLFTRTAVLWAATPIGTGMFYLEGRNLVFMANLKHHIIHASAIAFGNADEDLELAVRNLAERVRDMLSNRRMPADGEEYADDIQEAAEDEDEVVVKWNFGFMVNADLSERLAQVFASEAGLEVNHVATSLLTNEQGVQLHSTLPQLIQQLPLSVSHCSSKALWMTRAEKTLPWASLASLLLAVALVGQATNWTLTAQRTRLDSQNEAALLLPIQERIAALRLQNHHPVNYPTEQLFIQRSLAIAKRTDPVSLVNTLRLSSTEGIRILRLYLDNHAVATTDSEGPILIIEGIVDPVGSIPVDSLLARFVGHLRHVGYQALPVANGQSSMINQTPAGYFSYQLQTNAKENSGEARQP